ncbi:MAG: MFS transporter [Planctomycetes bacterium]|nr:MFS transporter [Planctomycetota bacterium]
MTPPEPDRLLTDLDRRHGMRLWNASSALFSVYSAITSGAVCTGYALHLGASNALIGVLSAAPSWGQALQMLSPVLIERVRTRKPLCLATYAIGCGLWLPIAFIPFLFTGAAGPWALIILVTLGGAVTALASPASTAWFADLVPEDARARYIARLNNLCAAVALISSLAAGRYMDFFSPARAQTGFMSLFILAVVFAGASIAVWAKVVEPPKHLSEHESLLDFLTGPFRHTHFRNFTLFGVARGLAVMIAGPFFNVYMLQNLGIPYAHIAIFSAMLTVSYIASNPLWARLAENRGYRPILRFSTFGLALFPLPFVFATPSNYWFVIAIAQLWGGVMCAGFVLADFNLMIKIAPLRNRSVYIGFYQAMVNLAWCVGSLLGGALADLFARFAPLPLLGYALSNIQCLFLLSVSLRLASLALLRYVREEQTG